MILILSEKRTVKGFMKEIEGHFLDAYENKPQTLRYGNKGISQDMN